MLNILIVDDEKIARLKLKNNLKDFNLHEAATFDEAIQLINNNKYDICFIDLNLNDQSVELFGLEVLKSAVERGFYSIIMSSVQDDEIIEHAYEIGCQEFFNKGKEDQSVKDILTRYLLQKDNYLQNYFLKEVMPTHSNKQQELIKKLIPYIQTDIPLCILGESGTGKTYLANHIHEKSQRKGLFVEVNCGALSEELLDAELFGHAKGAFSGAVSDQKGKLLLADNGTIFLDEIGSMSEKMQAKLLKAIEEKSFFPVNSDKKIHSDFRVISATLDDLETKIKEGKFRFDLFQRICGFSFHLLPLRERKEDILDLIKSQLDQSQSINNKKIILSKDVKEKFLTYDWPGNVRQLLRVTDLLIHQNKGLIQLSDVSDLLNQKSNPENFQNMISNKMLAMAKEKGLSYLVDHIEKEIVLLVLAENNGSIRKTMKDLSINQSKVYKFKDNKDYNDK